VSGVVNDWIMIARMSVYIHM